MENKLYVGNLPYQTTQQDLEALFGEVGTVIEAVVITDRDSGRSKGFGFVTMETPELAQEAIAKFNGTEYEGREIVVNVARPKE